VLRRILTDKEQMRAYLEAEFRRKMGFTPDLDRPKRLSERLCALYLREKEPLRAVLAGREGQMELLRAKRQEKWIPRAWGECEKFGDVKWKELPERVFLRADHLPGEEYALDRTQKGWKRGAKSVIREWMRRNAFEATGRPECAFVEPKVCIEEYREGETLCALCMGGEIRAMYWQGAPERVLNGFGEPLAGGCAEVPECMAEINAFCREVSAEFAFMKIELLIGNGQPKCTGVYLFEEAAFFRTISRKVDEELGSMLRLPGA